MPANIDPESAESSIAGDNRRTRRDGDIYDSSDDDLSEHDINILDNAFDDKRFLDLDPSPTTPFSQRFPSPPSTPSSERPRSSQRNEKQYQYHSSSAKAYAASRQRRPLIDFVKNEWRNQPHAHSRTSSNSSVESEDALSWIRWACGPGVRRSTFVLLGICFLIWGNWQGGSGTQYHEKISLSQSAMRRLNRPHVGFGQNRRVSLQELTQVKTLDSALLPQERARRRLIFIGDVHGCIDELQALLLEAQYDAQTDHVIFTGDLIAKGPSPAAVVELASSMNASCVRGNHEDRLLLTYRDLANHPRLSGKRIEAPARLDNTDLLSQDDSLDKEIPAINRLGSKSRKLARELSRQHIDYLSTCPLILDVGNLPGLGNVQVVHAGLVPGLSLDQQDPVSVMSMRTIDLYTHVPSSNSKGTPWFKLWNKYQSLLPADEQTTIIYGHDSHKGLQLEDFSKGLDSGCVKGGKLTALVIDRESKPDELQLHSVDCRDYREEKQREFVQGSA